MPKPSRLRTDLDELRIAPFANAAGIAPIASNEAATVRWSDTAIGNRRMSWPRDNADDEWTYEGEADTDRVAEEAAEPPVPPDQNSRG